MQHLQKVVIHLLIAVLLLEADKVLEAVVVEQVVLVVAVLLIMEMAAVVVEIKVDTAHQKETVVLVDKTHIKVEVAVEHLQVLAHQMVEMEPQIQFLEVQ